MPQPGLSTPKAVDYEEQFFIPLPGHQQRPIGGLQTCAAPYTCDRNGYNIHLWRSLLTPGISTPGNLLTDHRQHLKFYLNTVVGIFDT